ncbi:MAG: hypothetical protein DRP94_01650 [Candidatus Latescibacterota bacterium]|nr:MAG: hypothetical protein DRP94_01650 [Candidatus Latescibacterota bacterium]
MRYILLAISAALLPLVVRAQEPPPFLFLAKGDTVYIWLSRTPRIGWGFEVYRRAPGEREFRKLTPEPIRGARTPEEVQSALGDLYRWVAEALDADNPFQVLRRLRSDSFRGSILSLLDMRVARVLGRLYVDTTATGPGPYRYRIVLVDRLGRQREILEGRVEKDERIPLAPSGLEAEPGDGKVTLRWSYPLWKGDPQDLAIRFFVYRKGPGEAKFRRADTEVILREQKEDFSFTDVWVRNGRSYTYYVVAVDPLGREGRPSKLVRVVPVDNVPPAVPKGLEARFRDGKVVLAWQRNLELDLAGYRVYRSLDLRGGFRRVSPLLPPDMPFYEDGRLVPGRIYYYRVTAVDSAGNESRRSNAVSILVEDREPPQPPGNVKVAVGPEGRRITWSRSPSADVMGYNVYWGEIREQLPRLNLERLPSSATSYRDEGEGVTPGRSYWVAVTAVDSAFNESPKNPILVKVPDWKPPEPPSYLNARTLPDGRIKLVWGGSTSLDLVSYRLYRGEQGKADSLLGEFGPEVHTYTDRDIVKGRNYTYSVVAVDKAGNESPRREVRLEARDHVPPAPPRNIVAKVTPKGVLITWGRVADPDLAGYYVYRSDIPTGVFTRLNQKPLKERSFLDRTGTSGHWYKVRAVDTSGNESPWKKAVSPR